MAILSPRHNIQHIPCGSKSFPYCRTSVTSQDIIVRLGVWDRTRTNDILPVEERRLIKFILHPEYASLRSFSHDLALLKLDFPVVYGPHIQPICLPRPGDDFTGSLGTVTGWGRLQFKEDRPAILQHAEIPIIDNGKCERMFEIQRTPEKVIKQMMCASADDGAKDACQVCNMHYLYLADVRAPHLASLSVSGQ